MSTSSTTCPFPLGSDPTSHKVATDGEVLTIADTSATTAMLEDIAYHGGAHDHLPGGFSVCGSAVGIPVPFDGVYVAHLHPLSPSSGTLLIDLDRHDHSVRDVELHQADESGVEGPDPHDHAHDHGHVLREGWSEPVEVEFAANTLMFGDPLDLLDQAWSKLLLFPVGARGGVLRLSSRARDGVIDQVAAHWTGND